MAAALVFFRSKTNLKQIKVLTTTFILIPVTPDPCCSLSLFRPYYSSTSSHNQTTKQPIQHPTFVQEPSNVMYVSTATYRQPAI